MPEVIINGRFLTSQVTGVQRYGIELFRSLDLILENQEYRELQFLCLVPPDAKNLPEWSRIKIEKVGINRGNLWEQVDLPLHARGRLIFSPANSGPVFYFNQVVTLHDANVFLIPQAYSFLFRLKYYFSYFLFARFARQIITDSVFSQGELARYLHVRPDRIIPVLLGGDHLERIPADAGILGKRGLTSKGYLLSVSSLSKHKNFERLVSALQLVKTDLKLAATGGSNRIFKPETVQSAVENVIHLGFVSDQGLKALYENALAFISPSLFEGFGLPILEAMSCGCPVICSKSASLPEAGRNAALYFDPYDVENMAETIEQLISNPDLQDDLIRRGYENVAGFRWEATALKTLKIIQTCSGKESV